MNHRIVHSTLACGRCQPLDASCPDRQCVRNFVCGAWSSSLHHSRDSGMITAEDFAGIQRPQVAKICARPESKVMIAIGETADDAFLGFIAGEPEERIVYYCFVKELYRQRGIARALFAALGVDPRSQFAFPAETRILTKGPKLRTKIPFARLDPAVARYPKSKRHRSHA